MSLREQISLNQGGSLPDEAPLPMAPVILAENISKRFGKLEAVSDLNLEIAPGELFGLVGPDGAGKTTTLRMLATVSTPTSGRLQIAGLDAARQAGEIRRRAGYMSQQFNLYADLTVRENMEFFADIFAVHGPERHQRLERLLQFVRLDEFQKRRAGNLSGGMKRKLALACALVHQPEIVYLDEPTTGVDPVSRREFWDLLSDLHIQGVTILVSTPYMDEAERCSRVGLMHRGKLVVCGTLGEITALVDGEIIEVRPLGAASAGVGVLLQAQAALSGMGGVREVQVYGDLLHLIVDDAVGRMPQVSAALAERGIEVEGMRQIQPRMEEAFISLVQRQEEA